MSNQLCVLFGLADFTVCIACLAQNTLPCMVAEPEVLLASSSVVDPFLFKAFDGEMAQHVIVPGQ